MTFAVQSTTTVTLGQLAGALALIAVAVAVSIWWKADLEGKKRSLIV